MAFLLCGLIVLAVVPRLPKMPHEGEATSVGGFFALAPLLLFAVFAAAAFEQTLISLFAVYGAALGSAEARIASLIACFIAGNAVLQILLGRVAERFGSTRTMLFCALASLAGCLLLPSIFNAWLIWPLVFVWGGVSFGIYTMSLIQLGERFTGQALIAGNAAFAFVWGIGGIVGLARDRTGDATDRTSGAAIVPWPAVLCTGGVSDGGETARLIAALASRRIDGMPDFIKGASSDCRRSPNQKGVRPRLLPSGPPLLASHQFAAADRGRMSLSLFDTDAR